jgi:hypothetical protein
MGKEDRELNMDVDADIEEVESTFVTDLNSTINKNPGLLTNSEEFDPFLAIIIVRFNCLQSDWNKDKFFIQDSPLPKVEQAAWDLLRTYWDPPQLILQLKNIDLLFPPCFFVNWKQLEGFINYYKFSKSQQVVLCRNVISTKWNRPSSLEEPTDQHSTPQSPPSKQRDLWFLTDFCSKTLNL